MEKKKLVHIVESFGSGVYSFLVDLVNNTSNDIDITILYGVRAETPENFEKDFNSNVKFIKINNFIRSINFKKDLKAIKEVKQNIKEIKPDIVHLHSSKAGVIGRIAINGRKAKMFYNPHGFSFLKQDDSKIKRMIYWCIEKLVAIFNRRCVIIGCSNGEYQEGKKLNKRAICINNGINVNKMDKLSKNLTERQIDLENLKVCTIGRIGNQKNPKFFNEIAEAIPKIQYTWIGDGEHKDILQASNITVTGWKDRNEVLKILNDNDIFLLVSLWEGLPISLLEAMYMKKICIVSNVIGNRDVIKNNENGFICESIKDYLSIIDNIRNNNVNSNIRDNAYKSILEVYNIDKMTEEYKKVYLVER